MLLMGQTSPLYVTYAQQHDLVSMTSCHMQIQRPVDRLRKTSTAIAAGLAVIHLGMFVMMYMLMNNQLQLVSQALIGLLPVSLSSSRLLNV
jgi:hypothetical protein